MSEEKTIRDTIAELSKEYDEKNLQLSEIRLTIQNLGMSLPIKKPDLADPTKEIEEYPINPLTGDKFTKIERDALLKNALTKSENIKKKTAKLKEP